MSDMYNKIFTKILDSSIWSASESTRIVWVTFIAAMDETGMVHFAGVDNVANRARVPLDRAKLAIEELERPDPDSSDPENEGRRIERVPGGWIVMNASKYRALVTKAIIQEQTRQRVAKWRENERKRNAPVTHAKRKRNAPVTPSRAVSKARSKAEDVNGLAPARAVASWTSEACDDWGEAYGGTAPGGRIGKALKPLVEKVCRKRGVEFLAAWALIRPWWQKYLKATDARFASPESFASKPKQAIRVEAADAMFAGSMMGLDAALKLGSQK